MVSIAPAPWQVHKVNMESPNNLTLAGLLMDLVATFGVGAEGLVVAARGRSASPQQGCSIPTMLRG